MPDAKTPAYALPPWRVEPEGPDTINGHEHITWPVCNDERGIALVIMPLEHDTPATRRERAATAAFIVRCANGHNALVTALRSMLAEDGNHVWHAPYCSGWNAPHVGCNARCKAARAALKLTEEA